MVYVVILTNNIYRKSIVTRMVRIGEAPRPPWSSELPLFTTNCSTPTISIWKSITLANTSCHIVIFLLYGKHNYPVVYSIFHYGISRLEYFWILSYGLINMYLPNQMLISGIPLGLFIFKISMLNYYGGRLRMNNYEYSGSGI